MGSKKCLVHEAMEKCQCESCEQQRVFRRILIEQHARILAIQVLGDSLREAKEQSK